MFSRLLNFVTIVAIFMFVISHSAYANIFGDKPSYEAKFSVDKKICIGDPSAIIDPELCTAATLIAANSPVYYVITTENPWGEPAQTIKLDDNYPNGFSPTGSVTCQTSGGVNISAVTGQSAPTIATFPLGLGEKVHCLIPGTYSASGQKSNTVKAVNTTGYQQNSKSNVTVARANPPLGSDLSVTKTVKSPRLVTSNGTGQILYQITVKNNGPSVVNIGDVFKLNDQLSLLPNSVPFRATLAGAGCTSTPGTDCVSAPFQYGSNAILVGTSAPENFLRWTFASGKGRMAVGGSFTLDIEVNVEQLKGLSCIRAPRSDGLRNTAFFTLTAKGKSISESNPVNNTATITNSIETGNSTLVADCGKGHLRMTKTQLKPSNRVKWGSTVYYEIEVENMSIPPQDITIPAGGLEDWVTQGLNTPPFIATSGKTQCTQSTDPAVCQALNASFNTSASFNSSYYGQTHKRWDSSVGKSFKLRHGHKFTVFTEMAYVEPDCETVPAAPNKPVINTARLRYRATAFGAASASAPQTDFLQAAKAVTDMQDQRACKFEVTKKAHFKGPIKFGVPAKYSVTYTNNDAPRTIGTIMDAIRISQPGYANALPFTSNWTCGHGGSVSGYAASGAYSSGATTHTSLPAQGASVGNFRANSAQPIKFATGSSLKCDISVTVKRPPLNSNLCTSAPIYLENTALMDVTYPFNNNIHWPPSGTYIASQTSNPSKQDKNWAAVQAELPKCIDLTLNKTANVPGLPGGSSLWSYANGPDISYELSIQNDAQSTLSPMVGGGSLWPFHGIVIEDYLPGAAYTGQGNQRLNSACSTPSGWCSQSTINPSRQIGLRSLASGAVGKWTYDIPGSMLQVGKDIENCAVLNPQGRMNPNQGLYYTNFASPVPNPSNTPQSDCVTVPVIQTTTINITKTIDDQTGGNVTRAGPFEFTATCSPFDMFTGTEKVSVMAGSTGTLNNVPSRSSCNLAETNLPAVPQAAVNACAAQGPGITAHWGPVQFSPSGNLIAPLNANGVNVTATNTLQCKETPLARFKIQKEFKIANDLIPLMGNWPYTFDVLCTPTGASPNSVTMVLPNGTPNTATITAAANSTCTITEALPPFPPKIVSYCAAKKPRGLPARNTPRPEWDAPTYSLPNPLQLTSNNMVQVVTNSWSCKFPGLVTNGGGIGIGGTHRIPVLNGPLTPRVIPPKPPQSPKKKPR